MDDPVRPQRDRLLQGGGQEGVVDGDFCPCCMGCPAHSFDVGQAHQRVGRRLDQHQFRLAGEDFIKGSGVGEVDKGHLEMTPPGPGVQQAVRAAVAVVRREDQIAGRQLAQHQIDGGHAAGGDDGAGAAFQRRQGLAQQVAGRISRAAVVVAAFPLQPVEAVVGAQVQGRHDRTMGRVLIDPDAGEAGSEVMVGGGTGHAASSERQQDRGSARAEAIRSATTASSLRKPSWP